MCTCITSALEKKCRFWWSRVLGSRWVLGPPFEYGGKQTSDSAPQRAEPLMRVGHVPGSSGSQHSSLYFGSFISQSYDTPQTHLWFSSKDTLPTGLNIFWQPVCVMPGLHIYYEGSSRQHPAKTNGLLWKSGCSQPATHKLCENRIHLSGEFISGRIYSL